LPMYSWRGLPGVIVGAEQIGQGDRLLDLGVRGVAVVGEGAILTVPCVLGQHRTTDNALIVLVHASSASRKAPTCEGLSWLTRLRSEEARAAFTVSARPSLSSAAARATASSTVGPSVPLSGASAGAGRGAGEVRGGGAG